MIDDDVVRIARNRARIEIARQDQQLRDAIERVNAGAAAEGVAGSSIPLLRIAELCAEAAVARGDIVWQVLHRVLVTAGIRYEPYLESELKSLAKEFLSPDLRELRDIPRDAAQVLGIGAIVPHLEAVVAEGQRAGRDRAWNEIELFATFLKSAETMPHAAQPLTLNVYAPVGAIQTGHGSQANVAQGVDLELRRRLGDLLESIEVRLPYVRELPDEDRRQAIEMVREARIEAAQPQPNRNRLAGLLLGAAAAMRAIASLKPALDALKALAESLGFKLPW